MDLWGLGAQPLSGAVGHTEVRHFAWWLSHKSPSSSSRTHRSSARSHTLIETGKRAHMNTIAFLRTGGFSLDPDPAQRDERAQFVVRTVG